MHDGADKLKKHGIIRLEDGTYEFYWLGRRLSLEEFNRQIANTLRALKGEMDALTEGMDLGALFDETKEFLAREQALEGILRLPLCPPCRDLVERAGKGE